MQLINYELNSAIDTEIEQILTSDPALRASLSAFTDFRSGFYRKAEHRLSLDHVANNHSPACN